MKFYNVYKYKKNLENKEPLIHCITNLVTISDMAQVLTTVGARPLMAHSSKESGDITSISDGLVLNIGTLDDLQKDGMIAAFKAALKNNIPVVIDPVGVHATEYRKEFLKELLSIGNPTVIKGNLSEIKSIVKMNSSFKGIDCLEGEEGLSSDVIEKIKDFSKERNIIIVVSGKRDLVILGEKTFVVDNGSSLMGKVTGSGCFLGALLAAFVASVSEREKVNKEEQLYASLSSVVFWGLCGEVAESNLEKNEGIFSFKHRLLDNISFITEENIKKGEKISEEF